jgi:stearoyl-CoA desaturase (Delta-9 desaturase)
MNAYFYRLWLPLQILTVYLIFLCFTNKVTLNPWIVFASWIMIGPIGIGVGFHRLFSHRQFATSRFFEVLLLYLGTAAAYAPPIFWCTTHIHHHKHSDTDLDFSSPKVLGFWNSFLFWRLKKSALTQIHVFSYCSKLLFKDSVVKFFNRHFFFLFWLHVIVLYLVSPSLLLSLFILPVQIEHFRINLVTALSHSNIPFNYRNFETSDNSQNNLVLGLLTFGFAWHNNHHFNERAMILKNNWWEIDFEGFIARCLAKKETKS